MPKLRMRQTILAALTEEMRRDPAVVVFGLDGRGRGPPDADPMGPTSGRGVGAAHRRLVIVEEGPFRGGWGTEIASPVSTELFGELRAPVVRVTAPDVPVPFPPKLERRYAPDAEYVDEQIAELVHTNRRPRTWWEREVITA